MHAAIVHEPERRHSAHAALGPFDARPVMWIVLPPADDWRATEGIPWDCTCCSARCYGLWMCAVRISLLENGPRGEGEGEGEGEVCV